MVPLGLDRDRIERVLAAACQRLKGEWLLIGGAVAAVWFSPTRKTEDIDIVAFHLTNAEQEAVIDVALAEGLPAEAVNLTAAYFVSKIEGWRDEIEVLRRGPHVTIYRPTPTLFLLLKINRLGEEDLEDCLALLAHVRAEGLALDLERVLAALMSVPPTEDHALDARRRQLAEALQRG